MKAAILLLLDNVTAIAYQNRNEWIPPDTLSHLAVDVWRWCIVRNIVIHAENIPGRENVLVPTHVGLQRLDAGPECIHGTRQEVWTILDGSLCHHEQTIMSQPTAAGLGAGSRQLNTPFWKHVTSRCCPTCIPLTSR